MCGIGAILTSSANVDLDGVLGRMLGALRHRGPDAEGTQIVDLPGGRRLGLVHTRLSILDVSPAGNQPMHDPESNSWIVFNGEIYNHLLLRRQLGGQAWRSTSDTETLLRGFVERHDSFVDSLRGMFAFALLDGRRHELLLARDRLGIKPLYAARTSDGTWLFASEVRAILASGLIERRIDPSALDSYLAFGAVAAPWTIVREVQSLLPGECWRFALPDNDAPLAPVRTRYWRPRFAASDVRASYEESALRVRAVMTDAMTQHMLSDVPVGVFLSGGIDSSGIVATLTHKGIRPHTFSVLFSERDYDEAPYAELVARHFGTEHTPLRIQPDAMLAEFNEALAAYDQPSIDGVNTYVLTQAIHQAGIKVAISGLGGDELFAGYPYFQHARLLDSSLARGLARLGLAAMSVRGGTRSARVSKLRALLSHEGTRLESYLIFRGLIPAARRTALLRSGKQSTASPLPAEVATELEAATRGLDVTNAFSLLELSLYMANMLLRDTDQMSMAHPVEVRVPFLDHELVECVASLPGAMKLSGGWHAASKQLLLDALPQPLPKSIAMRRKMGFVLPWEHWLRGPMQGRVAEILGQRDVIEQAGLDPAGVERHWESFQTSHPAVRYSDILALVHLIEWTRRNQMSV